MFISSISDDVSNSLQLISTKELLFPLSIGLSLSYPNKNIICFQDANSCARSLDSWLMIKKYDLKNIVLFVFNNNDLDLNLKKTALNFGFKYAYQINKSESIDPVMEWVNEKNDGCRFIEVNCYPEEGKEYNINPFENCKKFREKL